LPLDGKELGTLKYDTPNTNHITDFCGLPYHLGYNSFIGTRTNQTNSWFKIGNALAIPDPAQVTFASFPTVARVMTAGWQERAELRMATIDFKVDGGFDFIEGS